MFSTNYMSDEESLRYGICVVPGDDHRRSVYADWCEENGQAEKTEFIRVQVKLGEYKAAEFEHKQLRKTHPHMLPYGGNCDCSRLLESQKPCPYCQLRSREEKLLKLMIMQELREVFEIYSGMDYSWGMDGIYSGRRKADYSGQGVNRETLEVGWIWERGFVGALSLQSSRLTEKIADYFFTSQPITNVWVYDKRPVKIYDADESEHFTPGQYYWRKRSCSSGERDRDPAWLSDHDIDDHIFDIMVQQEAIQYPGDEHLVFYMDRDVAVKSLSDAYVEYGRRLVGLPSLFVSKESLTPS